MRSLVYFYQLVSERQLALICVECLDLLGLNFPPIVEWEGCLYYWNEAKGGYCSWFQTKDVPKIGGHDVVEDFRRKQECSSS